jgi:cellulose synthase/poly-beta-1,6-N-acetylglucosamine synthase-like glycosyltransferase
MMLFWALSIGHFLIFIYLFLRWKSLQKERPEIASTASTPGITVLVPFRNEAKNLPGILEDLENQTYDPKRFEVIFINDHSEDESVAMLERSQSGFLKKVVHLPPGKKGKKAALTLGVSMAAYEVIACTDADCELPRTWLTALADYFGAGSLKMLTAPVELTGTNALQRLQQLEFSGLIAFGAITLEDGRPGMCNGANLSYLKSAFLEVGGYQDNLEVPSGDDEFLLQKIYRKNPGQVRFVADPRLIVKSKAKASWRALINQRIRWTSKWKFHKSTFIKFISIFIFFDFASVLAMYASLSPYTTYLIFLIMLRWTGEHLFLRQVSDFFQLKSNFNWRVLLSFFYPFYVLFLGITSIFGKYSWKGRSY